jgi:Dolichyl-phosphate-mannose-protein mannosyltransferase
MPLDRLCARLNAVADQIRARRWTLWLCLALPPLVLMAIFIFAGIRGVNFGFHWDEVDWQVRPVRDMVASGIIMPRAAIYPTFCKWLTLLPAIPAGIWAATAQWKTPRGVQAAMLAVLDRPDYLLILRGLYVVVSSFAIAWVYAAVLALRRTWWEALIAASCLALSWEYSYHSRWVATDTILVQFSALTLLMLAVHHRTGKRGWLFAAAVAAGLATGTKYPGVVLLVPVLAAGAMTLPPVAPGKRPAWAHVRRGAAIAGLAFATYLLTTPATVFEPFNFFEQYHWIARQYRLGHGGHAVSNARQHFLMVFEYFSLAYFSPVRGLAIALFIVMLFGANGWFRADRRMAALLIGFPVAYLLFFCLKFKDVIARNYLIIVPFLAVMAGRGFADLIERTRVRWGRYALGTAIAAALVANATWTVRAGESIRSMDDRVYVRDALTYVSKHPDRRFFLSPKVRTLASEQQLPLPDNLASLQDAQEWVFFARAEGPVSWDWKCNDPWLTRAVFGPREINFVWYGGWMGHDRVVSMTPAKARGTGVNLEPQVKSAK